MEKVKVGDIVTGNRLSDDEYGITNTGMIKGEVIEVYSGVFTVKVLEHKNSDHVGDTYPSLEPKFFNLVEEVKVEVVKAEIVKKDTVRFVEDALGTYIIVNEKYTIFTTAKQADIAIVNISDIELNVETAKLLAKAKLLNN